MHPIRYGLTVDVQTGSDAFLFISLLVKMIKLY